jgi:hypothetical protein
VNEYRSVLERAGSNFAPLDLELESLLRRRDRKRRNQRIAAGVVGIAVFVAAIWIVTSGLSLDRSEKSVAPGGDVTGPAETGPSVTAPPPPLASGAPDVVRQERCSNGAGVRLELTDTGSSGPIEMRFELHRSPVGHTWHIRIEHSSTLSRISVVFEGTKATMGDSGHLVVQRPHIRDRIGVDRFRAEAFDTQTGQVCRVVAGI